MRNTIKSSLALAVAAALAGCASGGGGTYQDEQLKAADPITRLVVCVFSLGTECPKGTASQATASGSSGSSSYSASPGVAATAGVAAPRPGTFTRWEDVSAPGTIADGLYVGPLAYHGSADRKVDIYTSYDSAEPATATIDVAGNGTLIDASMLSGRELEFDGRALPGQPGILYGSSFPVSTEQASLFVDVTHPEIPYGSGYTGRAVVGAMADPFRQGWSYQSFGVWNTRVSEGGGALYASTFGAPTPASAVPASGAATFSGKLAGSYVSPGGEGSLAAAEVRVAVDFGARSLSFASSGTTLTRDLSSSTPAPGLDLKGTLTYAASSGSFSGTLANAAGTIQGNSAGRFYGPAAQELGGVFGLAAPKLATPEAFVGAYGAKR